ncbi:MAG: hypothetical protein ACN6NZ_03925, partial [Burkholderiales bacterium]
SYFSSRSYIKAEEGPAVDVVGWTCPFLHSAKRLHPNFSRMRMHQLRHHFMAWVKNAGDSRIDRHSLSAVVFHA